jgi:hypothetical protein
MKYQVSHCRKMYIISDWQESNSGIYMYIQRRGKTADEHVFVGPKPKNKWTITENK